MADFVMDYYLFIYLFYFLFFPCSPVLQFFLYV